MRDRICLIVLSSFPGVLRAEFDIGTTGGPLDFITTAFQTAVDFLTGPAALAFLVGSIVVGGVMWAYAPRSGALGIVFRAIMVLLVIFNLTLVVNNLR